MSEQNRPNKTKFYVLTSVIAAFVISGVVASIMVSNYQKDNSKERYKLTKIYKELKDAEYTFDFPRGHIIFTENCVRCHGKSGQGIAPIKSLAKSDLVLGEPKRPLRILIHGLQNQKGIMPGFKQMDYIDMTHVLNYIRNSFGNKAEIVHPVETIKNKIDTIDKKSPYQTGEY